MELDFVCWTFFEWGFFKIKLMAGFVPASIKFNEFIKIKKKEVFRIVANGKICYFVFKL